MPVLSPDTPITSAPPFTPSVARLLLADDDLASRLTLKSIFTAAGYYVDGAASASEAIWLLEHGEYQLVMADLQSGVEDAAKRLLSYARQKEYRPATARITSRISELDPGCEGEFDSVVTVSHDHISDLLERVADLISHRADRRMLRTMRQAC